MRDSSRSGRAATSGSIASMIGPYGGRPSSSRPAPRNVCQPRACASSSTASTSRVFPIPASPRINSAPPPPRAVASSALRAAASSRSRPTIGGLDRVGACTGSPRDTSRYSDKLSSDGVRPSLARASRKRRNCWTAAARSPTPARSRIRARVISSSVGSARSSSAQRPSRRSAAVRSSASRSRCSTIHSS